MSFDLRKSTFDIPYLTWVFEQTGLHKQCRPLSDAAERGVWSGSTLIAIHPPILDALTSSEMDVAILE